MNLNLPDSVSRLIEAADTCPLGPGQPNAAVREALGDLRPESVAKPPIRDRQMAACCVSGLWLLHNYLDESHTISQDIATPEGSYWHGIMHRREPDFSNGKYWFRRVGEHPVYEQLPAAVARIQHSLGLGDHRLDLLSDDWDALLFVDLCEEAYSADEDSDLAEACRQVAAAEWELLFRYCLTRAT